MLRINSLIFFACLIFLAFKIYSSYLTNFDLFGDEAQYWLWSKNLDFGYYSKPPFLSWVIFVFTSLFSDTFITLKIIPIVFYCFTSWIVFLISKNLNKSLTLASITSLTFFLMPAVTVSSFIVSTDVMLVFFWSLSILIILQIRKDCRKINFVLLGIFVGLAFLSKYAGAYIFISIFFLFFEKEMRKIFFKNKLSLLLAAVIFLIVISPNIIWNYIYGWPTFSHTAENAALERVDINFINGITFTLSQILMIGPLLFLFFIPSIKKNFFSDFTTRFLVIFIAPVFLIILFESVLVRANANWAAVSLVSMVVLFTHSIYKINKKFLYLNNICNFLIGVVFFGLIATSSSLQPFNRISGITSFALDLNNLNSKNYKHVVVVDRLLFSNLNYINKKSDLSFFAPLAPGSKINHHFQMSNPLSKNFNKNFIYVGHLNEIKYLSNIFEAELIAIKKIGFRNEELKIYEVIF